MLVLITIAIFLDLFQLTAKHHPTPSIDIKQMKDTKRDTWTKDQKTFGCIAFLNAIIGMPIVIYSIIAYPSWITLSILATQVTYQLPFVKNSKILQTVCDLSYIALLFYFGITL